MRALVLSDIHANIDALLAVETDALHGDHRFDQIWVLGDLVDYGPAPGEVIAWVQHFATRVVRGNHDHAMGTGEDCRSAPLYHDLAVATREHFRKQLSVNDLAYLANLPLQSTVKWRGDRELVLVHASPQDQLFGYVPTDSPVAVWRAALAPARSAEFVLVGHTHDQFTRQIDDVTLVNPGSVGMPKDGDPRAAFAVFDNGRVELRRVAYDTGRAAARIAALPLASDHRHRLTYLIRHARLPEHVAHKTVGAHE
jgi:predicted phosphodiesterase